MFRECPDIKGTEDERKAADALIEFTKGFGCSEYNPRSNHLLEMYF